jgi:flagellar protein FlbT
MPLKITLKPGEKVAVNGAMIVNGARRASFIVENHARVLRERDMLQPSEATSAAKRLYIPIMLMYLDPVPSPAYRAEYERRHAEALRGGDDPRRLEACREVAAHVARGDFYRAMAACRNLIALEEAPSPERGLQPAGCD